MKEAEIDGKTFKVVTTVDAVGLFCPLPVVKLSIEIERVSSGQVIELLADDPGVLEDLPSWCRETDNKLLALKKNEDDVFVAYVEKQG